MIKLLWKWITWCKEPAPAIGVSPNFAISKYTDQVIIPPHSLKDGDCPFCCGIGTWNGVLGLTYTCPYCNGSGREEDD
jgi:hypothetical protein